MQLSRTCPALRLELRHADFLSSEFILPVWGDSINRCHARLPLGESMKPASLALSLVLSLASIATAQANTPSSENPPFLTKFPFENSAPLNIVREVVPSKPFTVVGPRGAMLGRQDGSFEAWIFPWKIFSNFRISAEMQNYPVPIDVNEHAAVIAVRPDQTTIRFAHANFTVREILFAPRGSPDGTGALAFFQIEAVRPITLTLEFTPEMKRMWPALSDDRPSPE